MFGSARGTRRRSNALPFFARDSVSFSSSSFFFFFFFSFSSASSAGSSNASHQPSRCSFDLGGGCWPLRRCHRHVFLARGQQPRKHNSQCREVSQPCVIASFAAVGTPRGSRPQWLAGCLFTIARTGRCTTKLIIACSILLSAEWEKTRSCFLLYASQSGLGGLKSAQQTNSQDERLGRLDRQTLRKTQTHEIEAK